MRLVLAFSLAASALAAYGQAVPPQQVPLPRVVLTEPAVGRSAPPSGPLNVIVGGKVRALPKGAEVDVLGSRSYGAFRGSHVWLEVQPPSPSASGVRAAPVWIYGGVRDGKSVMPSGVTAVAR